MELGGKTAVVTGSSRGLGREVAVALSARGADMVLFARDAQSLEETAALVKEQGRDPLVVSGDVSSLEDVKSLKLASKERFGMISILVNAAGTFGPISLITESDSMDWINTVLTNAIGPYLTSHAFVPDMVASGWGRVVNVSSAAAFMDPGPLNSAYSVSKAALNRFTRHLSSELAETGVTANVLHPGSLRTPMWSDIRSKVETVPAATTLRGWVDLVDETGGDSMEEAVRLILSLVDPASTKNGEFCWPDNMVVSDPIPSW